MSEIYWLDHLDDSLRLLVGEKALALGHLLQKGYPIQKGFVIPGWVLRDFLSCLGEPLLADLPDSSLHLNIHDYRSLQQMAQHIQGVLATAPLPEAWLSSFLMAAEQLSTSTLILRPSLAWATEGEVNWGGVMRSQTCWCNPQSFERALKLLWGELFRARSLFFWQKSRLQLHQLYLGVLVQPLEEAIASGDAVWTEEGALVQAIWGLGQGLVRGEVEPDRYQRSPVSGEAITQSLGHKSRAYHLQLNPVQGKDCFEAIALEEEQEEEYTLNEGQLSQLSELLQRLQTETGGNFYLEWVLSQDQIFYLTQYQTNSDRLPSIIPLLMEPSLSPLLIGVSVSPGRVVAPVQALTLAEHSNQELMPGAIIVTQSILAESFPFLQQAAGLVLEGGSIASHGAIMARELGIPALVGVIDATQQLRTGEMVILDGDRGEIRRYHGEDPEVSPPETVSKVSNSYPITTQLLVNLSLPKALARVEQGLVDGVGLLRSELMILELLQSEPLEIWLQQPEQLTQELETRIKKFAVTFAPRPVFYRSTDWRSPEFTPLSEQSSVLLNPIIGARGTYYYRHHQKLFTSELMALKRVRASYDNVHLLLPFVRSVEEFIYARDRVAEVGLSQDSSFQLWIMAEVPSVLFLLPDYVKAGVQGISIGTNDLTQLLLGVDREHSELARLFDERHPAVLGAIKQLIREAKALGIPCSICGYAPAKFPEIIKDLVKWGITSISVEPAALTKTYWAIARAEQSLLLEAVR